MDSISFLRSSMIASQMLNDSEDLFKIFRDWKIDFNDSKYSYTFTEKELHYILKTKSVNVLYEYCNLLNVSWNHHYMYPNYVEGVERFVSIHIKDGEATIFIPKETDKVLHEKQVKELISMQKAIDLLKQEDDFSVSFSEDSWLKILSNINVDKQDTVTLIHNFVDTSIYDEFKNKLREFPMYTGEDLSNIIGGHDRTVKISIHGYLWLIAIFIKYIKSVYERFGLEVKYFKMGYSKDKSTRVIELIF